MLPEPIELESIPNLRDDREATDRYRRYLQLYNEINETDFYSLYNNDRIYTQEDGLLQGIYDRLGELFHRDMSGCFADRTKRNRHLRILHEAHYGLMSLYHNQLTEPEGKRLFIKHFFPFINYMYSRSSDNGRCFLPDIYIRAEKLFNYYIINASLEQKIL